MAMLYSIIDGPSSYLQQSKNFDRCLQRLHGHAIAQPGKQDATAHGVARQLLLHSLQHCSAFLKSCTTKSPSWLAGKSNLQLGSSPVRQMLAWQLILSTKSMTRRSLWWTRRLWMTNGVVLAAVHLWWWLQSTRWILWQTSKAEEILCSTEDRMHVSCNMLPDWCSIQDLWILDLDVN